MNMLSSKDNDQIEELKKLIQKQQEEIFRLKFIIDNVPGNIYWKDREGKYLGANHFVCQMAGVSSPDQIIGKTDYELPWFRAADKVRGVDKSVMEKGKMLQIEEKPLMHNNKTTYLSQKTPLKNEQEEINGILGISLDITELKEAQEQAMKALEQKARAEAELKRALLIFAGMQSHDLRTTLCSIYLRSHFTKKYLPTLIETYKLFFELHKEKKATIQPKILADLEESPDDILRTLQEANAHIESSLKNIKAASLTEEFLRDDQLTVCNTTHLITRIIEKYPCDDKDKKLIHFNTLGSFDFKGNQIFFNRLIENLIKQLFEHIRSKGHGEILIDYEQGTLFNYLKIKDTSGGASPKSIDYASNHDDFSKDEEIHLRLASIKPIMQAFGGDISCELVNGGCIEFVLSFPKGQV